VCATFRAAHAEMGDLQSTRDRSVTKQATRRRLLLVGVLLDNRPLVQSKRQWTGRGPHARISLTRSWFFAPMNSCGEEYRRSRRGEA
jgi:hypothetical protein